MARDNPRSWMLSEAVEVLMRAERMHREVFQLRPTDRPPASGSLRSTFSRPTRKC